MSAARQGKAPEPTREQLRLAHRQIRRPHWGEAFDDLDAALAHPVRAACIRGLAIDLGRAAARAYNAPPSRPGPATAPPVPPTPQQPPPRRGPAEMTAPRFDRKRLAANDRDD